MVYLENPFRVLWQKKNQKNFPKKKKKKTKSNVFIVQYTAVLEFPLRVS